MKPFFISFFFILIFTSSFFSQDIEKEILNYNDIDIQIIGKSRKLIIDKLKEGDFNKVREILNYLDNKFDTSKVIVFWDTERWQIEYLINNLSYILNSSKIFKHSSYEYLNTKLQAPQDLIWQEIKELTKSKYSELQNNIEVSLLNNEEKDLLNLTLNYLVQDEVERKITQENVNSQADIFLEKYKYSSYTYFVRNYIRFVYKFSDWAYGYGIDLGFGSFTDGTIHYIKSYLPLGMQLDLYYKDFVSSLRFSAGVISKVKQEFEYIGIWKKDLKLNIYHAELSLGFPIMYFSNLRVNPYAGVALGNISPPSEVAKEDGNDVDLGTEFGFVFGFNTTISFSSTVNKFDDFSLFGDWLLNIRFGYSTVSFKDRNPLLNGNTYFITLGFGGISRSLFRDL
ncbi:MAG: hypothetical protein IPM32_15555 [Ignavibacteriae bacterium]|nr:hypothetical protein [Ignavibacteriota bacterium]